MIWCEHSNNNVINAAHNIASSFLLTKHGRVQWPYRIASLLSTIRFHRINTSFYTHKENENLYFLWKEFAESIDWLKWSHTFHYFWHFSMKCVPLSTHQKSSLTWSHLFSYHSPYLIQFLLIRWYYIHNYVLWTANDSLWHEIGTFNIQ